MPRDDDGSDEVAGLWAMVAELERQFAAYKQRLPERNGGGDGGEGEVEPGGDDDDSGGDVMRGRMYEAYVRRRDEKLRQGWRARMERKEAEVKALWAQLELSGRRAGGGGRPISPDAGDDEEGETERNDDQDKKRSSDAALAPSRVSGKKHARTRSFSSSANTSSNQPDVGRRRAVSQEPPPSEPQVGAVVGGACKESRARPSSASGAATTTKTKTATPRPKTSSRRRNSVKGRGSAKQTGPKPPRSLPRRASSGGLDDLGEEVVVVLPTAADAAAPLPLRRRSCEQNVRVETPDASPPRPSTSTGVGDDGAGNAQTASPGSSDRSEVVDVAPEGNKPEEAKKSADVKKHQDEVDDDAGPDQLGNPNGEVTSDSDIEPNFVYINGGIVKEQAALSLPQTRAAASVTVPDFSAKTNQDDDETTTPPAGGGATATGIARTNAEEAPARKSSSGDSSSSGRLGRSPPSPSSATPSCSSRDQSIERVLEADAALLRKKRAEKSALKTPGSAGSRVSGAGAARSLPKETPKGFKRFLSFGKKNRASREVTVVDVCTSPSVSSVADDDSGRWQSLSAGSIKPRMGSSDAASDGTDHARATSPRACSLQNLVAASPAKSELAEIDPQVKSPKAHRSFFSFRSLNCGRG